MPPCCDGLRVLILGGFLILCLGLITCGGEAPVLDPGPPDQTYDLRGKVVSLPDERQKEISVHHEAIPDFVGADGEIVGMDSMTMPFTVATEETLEGIEKGDKISFQLDVRWDGNDVVTVHNVEKLAAETVLDFEKPAEPEASEGQAEPEQHDPSVGEATDTSGNHEQHDHASSGPDTDPNS